MKTLIKHLLISLALLVSSFAHAADYEDYNKFLQRLGFEDYSAQAKATLDSGKTLSGIGAVALEQNVARYRVVDSSRILTLVIVEESFDKMATDAKIREKIINLATYLLQPHPMMTREPLPANIASIQDSAAYVKARSEYLTKKVYERYYDEKQTLLGVLADLAPSQDQKDMDSLVDNYLQTKYMDWSLQQTRYWGRAMAASLVRYARAHSMPAIETALRERLEAKGVYLGNFLSSTVKYKNEKKELITTKIYNGDFVNEYSRGADSFFISVGVEPTDVADKNFAKSQNLLGRKLQIPFYMEPDTERELLDKVRDHKPLTAAEKRKYEFIKSEPPVSGYSHVGMIEIRKDTASGIEMPWVWDVYPNANLGGIRFLGLEGFAYIEKFLKIGFVHYDAKKFHQYYVSRKAKEGYLPTVWKSWGAGYTDDGKVAEWRQRTHLWPSHISAEDVKKLQSYPADQAESWYSNEIIPRVLKAVKSYLVSEEAMVFARNFANVENASYCSQTFVLAFLQGVNVDPQVTVDRYSPLLKTVQKFHSGVADYFDVNDRIIAPSGFAWQSKLVSKHTMIDLDREWPVRNNAEMLAPLRERLSNKAILDSRQWGRPPAQIINFIEDDL